MLNYQMVVLLGPSNGIIGIRQWSSKIIQKMQPCRADAWAKSSLSGKAALEGSTPAAGALFAPVRFHWILEKHMQFSDVFGPFLLKNARFPETFDLPGH